MSCVANCNSNCPKVRLVTSAIDLKELSGSAADGPLGNCELETPESSSFAIKGAIDPGLNYGSGTQACSNISSVARRFNSNHVHSNQAWIGKSASSLRSTRCRAGAANGS